MPVPKRCSNCRGRKLTCSKEIPSCKRCLDENEECDYEYDISEIIPKKQEPEPISKFLDFLSFNKIVCKYQMNYF